MLLDFSSLETCNETLSKLISIPLHEIEKHLTLDDPFQNNEWVIEYINEDIFSNINNLSITMFHTTTIDNPQNIIDNGLLDLPTVVTKDTFLNNFLKRLHINFDIPNKKIIFNNESRSLDVDSNHDFYFVKNRLYNDTNVNGFYFNNTGKSQYSNIDEIPEFLQNVLEITYGTQKSMEQIINLWKAETSNYRIKAVVPLTKVDVPEDFSYKVVSKLIDIYLENSNKLEPDDHYIVYVNRSQYITPEEIVSITRVN